MLRHCGDELLQGRSALLASCQQDLPTLKLKWSNICCITFQELKHYSEAVKDLQQALDLEPNNKTFAKELDRLKQDCTEQRKQRAVLKQQLDSGNSLSQNPHVSVSAKQPVAQQKGDTLVSAGGVNNLQVLQNLVASLQTAGDSALMYLLLAAADMLQS